MWDGLEYTLIYFELWFIVPMVIALVVNIGCAVALTGAVIRKSKKCNDIKELE